MGEYAFASLALKVLPRAFMFVPLHAIVTSNIKARHSGDYLGGLVSLVKGSGQSGALFPAGLHLQYMLNVLLGCALFGV